MNYEPNFGDDIRSAVTDAQDPATLSRRRRLMLSAAGAVVLLIVLLWFVMSQPMAPAQGQADSQNIPSVTVVSAQPGPVTATVSGTGAIAARRDMPVGVVGEGGRVTTVHAEPGVWVKAGQILASIERSVQAQQVASLAASVNVARADAELAQSNLARAQALVGDGFISKADLESKKAIRDAAVARVNVAIAQLNQARADMARLDVRAPEAGLVLTRNVEAGQIVSGGSGVLFRIAKGGEMEMNLAVNEGDLSRIKIGDRADVRLIGAERPFHGAVWQISPVVDPQTRQGSVRILLDHDPALRPGAFAQATIRTGTSTGFVLPESAVQSDEAGTFVYVVSKDNKVVRRPITTGPVSDAGVSVIGGLSAGEPVILTAGGFLNPGDAVRPVRAQSGG